MKDIAEYLLEGIEDESLRALATEAARKKMAAHPVVGLQHDAAGALLRFSNGSLIRVSSAAPRIRGSSPVPVINMFQPGASQTQPIEARAAQAIPRPKEGE